METGAWVASDVVYTTTGEVLLEANSELTADKLAKILDATGVVELNLFFPERDDVGLDNPLSVQFSLFI